MLEPMFQPGARNRGGIASTSPAAHGRTWPALRWAGMRPRSRLVLPLLSAALLLALILAVTLGAPSHQSASITSTSGPSTGFDGAALPGEEPAQEFTLTDQAGYRVSLSDYRGQVTVLTFLYSTCGASCVVIAQQIRGALDELPRPVPVLVVSADPRADSPANVRRFLAAVSLTGRVRYLTGPLPRLRRIWRAYGVAAAGAGRTAFARAAPVLLLDRRGRRRVLFEQEQLTPESLAHDIRKLQAG
jgi:cytochrome oxidase Cu insertion factor (SCO1/SenC/PrrC family)